MKVLFFSDYIEGSHNKIASVRLERIFKEISKVLDLVIVTDKRNGKSAYGETIHYNTITLNNLKKNKTTTEKSTTNEKENYNISRFIYKVINVLRSTKKSVNSLIESSERVKIIANRKNISLIRKELKESEIIFVSVPSVFPIEMMKYSLDKKNKNQKIVIEIRDLIVNGISKSTNNPRYKQIEDYIFEHGDAFVFLTEGIKEHYMSRIGNKPNAVITNGYDEELVRQLNDQETDQSLGSLKEKRELNFLHLGSIYDGRNVLDFLKGIKVFIDKNQNHTANVKFIGNLDAQAQYEINEFKMETVSEGTNARINIDVQNPVSNQEAMSELKKTDIAVILTHRKGSEYAIPGKAFEYIGMGKPILSVTEDKSLKILIDGKFGICCRHDEREVAKNINELLKLNIESGSKNYYSRTEKAKELIRFLKNDI